MQLSKIVNIEVVGSPLFAGRRVGGADRDRTDDFQLAKLALSQLSYGPRWLVGLDRFELSTPRLSSVCSNQLSYRPSPFPGSARLGSTADLQRSEGLPLRSLKTGCKPTESELRFDLVAGWTSCEATELLRKEVIQPQVPLRLPCYDFAPVADLTVVGCLPLRGQRTGFG